MTVSVQTTANLAAGGAGLYAVAAWVQASWAAGEVVVPSTELVAMGLAALVPLAHLLWLGVYVRLERWAGGRPPAPGEAGGGSP